MGVLGRNPPLIGEMVCTPFDEGIGTLGVCKGKAFQGGGGVGTIWNAHGLEVFRGQVAQVDPRDAEDWRFHR